MATRTEYLRAHSYLLFQGDDLPTLTLRPLRHAYVYLRATWTPMQARFYATTYFYHTFSLLESIHLQIVVRDSVTGDHIEQIVRRRLARLSLAVSLLSTSWVHDSTSGCTDYSHFSTMGTFFSHMSVIRNDLYQDLWRCRI